jgi:hypothetical protein
MAGSRKDGSRATPRAEQLPLFSQRALGKLEREDERLWKTFFSIRIENRITVNVTLRTLRMLRRRFREPEDPAEMTW